MVIHLLSLTLLAFCTLNTINGQGFEDLPCRARDVGIPGRSIVCVCDSYYCDTITRVPPEPGQYVAYTTSLSGKRFEKSFGVLQTDTDPDPDEEEEVQWPEVEEDEEEDTSNAIYEFFSRIRIRLFLNTRFQTIEGFGGSVTDSAAINWKSLSEPAQARLIQSYFGKEGIEYNMVRTPIGGSDFSTHPYTLNDEPWDDTTLSNFSMTQEDNFYKLPMIKTAQNVATDEIKIIATTWSPPVWMKNNKNITGFSRLLPEYYQLYADYHMRFLEEYEKADVKIWGITTTNEPMNGVVNLVNFNSLGWSSQELGRWVADNLGPTVRNSRFNETKIIGGDDQRYIVPTWLSGMQREAPESIDYLDGIGIHYYGNTFVPPSVLTGLHNSYPGKTLIATEACEGSFPWSRWGQGNVAEGSWERVHNYVKFITQDLNNYVAGWIDWNLCLDPNGGPNWANNFVDAPIIVYKDKDEFIKQPMYYGIGHFSKFIPRGSRRIRAARRSITTIDNVAFLKPDGNIVMVLQNRKRRRDLNVRVKVNKNKFLTFTVPNKSIMTIEINPNE